MTTKIQLDKPISPVLSFSQKQLEHRDKIQSAHLEGTLQFKLSQCFCGETLGKQICSYDAWGFAIPTVICQNCQTIRSKYFLTEDSIIRFYQDGYYLAHMFTKTNENGSPGVTPDRYGPGEWRKAETIAQCLKNWGVLEKRKTVLEIGCGVGGILGYFSSQGLKAFGCDYKKEYIEAAQKLYPQVDFRVGGTEQFKDLKFDLIILSDLVEHLTNPQDFFMHLRPFLHERSLIYINVPGFLGIGPNRFGCSIRQFTKIEHTWCHTLRSLTLLLNACGYQLVKGDEVVRAVFSLNPTWTKKGLIQKAPWHYRLRLNSFIKTRPLIKWITFPLQALRSLL